MGAPEPFVLDESVPGDGPDLVERIASVERRLALVESEIEVVSRRVEALNRAKQTLTMVLMELVADVGGDRA